MRKNQVKVGGFYSLKDGLGIVRVERPCACGSCDGFLVWERDALDATRHVLARDMKSEVSDPTEAK